MITTLLLLLTISVVNGKQQPSALFTSEIDVNENCKVAVQRMSALQATEPQLMARYWDSWGKPSDALLTGHTTFLGYYDECTNLKDTVLGDMKYCLYAMAMDTNIIQSSSGSEDGVCHSSDCPTPMNVTTTFDVKIGVCYPSACSPNEFAIVLSNMNVSSMTEMTTDPFSKITNSVSIKLRGVGDSPAFCPVTDVKLDTGSKALIALCMVLVGLVIVGTLLDISIWLLSPEEPNFQTDKKLDKETIKEEKVSSRDKVTKDNKPHLKDFILAFSLYTTVPSLLMKQPPSAIKAVGAIKIFSNVVIVVLHVTFFLTAIFPALSQNSYQLQLFTRIGFQPIAGVTFAIESFFVVSATLSAYLTFKDMEKHKKFRLGYFYLNRFLRLSPLFYFYTLVAYKLSSHFGQGPLFFSQDAIGCAKTWWQNFFYITNLLPSFFDMCIPIAWQVTADMQLVILSPIFIILLYHTWYLGLIAIGMAMVGATAMVGYVSATGGFWAAMFYNPNYLEQGPGLHVKTFYRVNSYMVGILLGYILYKKYSIANFSIPNWLKHLTYALLWVVAIVLCSATMLAPYLEYGFIHHFTDFENVTFLMFSGLTWSIGVAIIIYICNTGYGGTVNSFLSWPGWDPLVKLSYGVALCHQMVIFFVYGSLQSGLKFSDLVFGMICLLVLVLSYMVSLMTALFVEQPLYKVFSLFFQLVGIQTRAK